MLSMKMFARFLTLTTAGVVLSACGGSDDAGGGGGGGSTTHAISGTAAVGAPLKGTVTVKDSAGATRTVTIGTNGSYSVDVTGMTGPFVFRATGTANGTAYVVHSAAVAADLDGTINITQLTDLVVDNIAGQLAGNYFNNGNFSTLTPAALNAEVAVLKQRLLPVLTALGVDSAIDLLRTQFTPLSSALDSALDLLRVTVDPATSVATITNVVTQQQITDSITLPASNEGSPPALTTVSNLGTAAADTAAAKAALTAFAARFATSQPTATAMLQSLTTDFLYQDLDRNGFVGELSDAAVFIGGSISDVDVLGIDYTNPSNAVVTVDASLKTSAGAELWRLTNLRIRKDTDGTWRLHGNQVALGLQVMAGMDAEFGTGTSRCIATGFDFDVDDDIPGNNGGTINHMVVYGPGLPNGSLRWVPPAGGSHSWTIAGTGSPSINLGRQCPNSTTNTVSDAVIAAIPDNAEYLVVAYSSADDSVRLNFATGALTDNGQFTSGSTTVARAGGYLLRLAKRPLTLAEAVAGASSGTTDVWPLQISAPTAATLAAYNGNGVVLNVTGTASTARRIEMELHGSSTTSSFEVEADATVNGSGAFSAGMSIPAALAAGTVRSLEVSIEDLYRREFTVEIVQAP
jgi:hypothetical protein